MSKLTSIRTLTGYCVYDPKRRVVITINARKYIAKKSAYPGCVIVEMKGTYCAKPQTRNK